MFSVSRKSEKSEPAAAAAPEPTKTAAPTEKFYSTSVPTRPGSVLSEGVSIKGSVKFGKALVIDGEVEGTISSGGTLTIGQHAQVRGEIRSKSVKLQGTVEGNIFATERCELHGACTLRGDVDAPRLVVNEDATFLGSAKIGRLNDASVPSPDLEGD
jgi:Integral membrane protein CcmA involved in cell shape determination